VESLSELPELFLNKYGNRLKEIPQDFGFCFSLIIEGELKSYSGPMPTLKECDYWVRECFRKTVPRTYPFRDRDAIISARAGQLYGCLTTRKSNDNLQPPEAAIAVDAQIELGKWAEHRLEDAKKVVSLVRGGNSPDGLRTQFPTLFTEVFDQLQEPRRKRLFEDAQRQLMSVPHLMSWIADVKQITGSTLSSYRKKYRGKMRAGGRKRRPRARDE
jgi:hypothetical protein